MTYVEGNIPDYLALRVRYITACRARSKAEAEALPRWTTIATLYDRATGEEVARAVANCGPRDNPSRKIGRAVAVGRAFKQFCQLAKGVEARHGI